jgi:hypothetical protein
MASVTTTTSETTAGSDTVVATAAESQLQQMTFPDDVQPTSEADASRASTAETASGRSLGTQSTPSAMPADTELNAPVLAATPSGLRIKSMSEVNSRMIKRLRQEIPTADLVSSGSYKINSKLLIKIVPSPKATALGKYVPQLTFDAFSLQSVAESDAERYQLHETFENFVLFLFGRRPRVWTMQGIVVNGRRAPDSPGPETPAAEQDRLALDMDWANTLLKDWEDFYRGSKSVEMGAQTYLAYEDSVVQATLLELTMVRNSQLPSAVNSTLTFVVHDRAFIGQQYREGFTAPNLAQLIEETNSNKFFGDKIAPSQILPAPITADEIARQRALAEEEQLAAQEATAAAAREREALEKAASEDEGVVAAAEAQIEQGRQAVAQAEADEAAALDSAAEHDAQQAKREALAEIAAAEEAVREVNARQGQNETRTTEVDTNLSASVSEEENKTTVVDAYESTEGALASVPTPDPVTRDWIIDRLVAAGYARDEIVEESVVWTPTADGNFQVDFGLETDTGSSAVSTTVSPLGNTSVMS